jgi:hypothetical protein
MFTPSHPDLRWRKSSRSNGAQACVELAHAVDGLLVRDSKNTSGPVLTVDPAFLSEIKSGRFDI